MLLKQQKMIYAWKLQLLIEKEFDFKPGKITPYRVLYRLEKQGLVKSKTEKIKRFYQITEKGKKELNSAKDFYQKLLHKLNK